MSTAHPDQEALAELAELADSADIEAGTSTAELRAHVAGCAQCSADLAALRDLRTTLRALPPISMPADVAARLEAALAEAALAEAVAAVPATGAADATPSVGAAADTTPSVGAAADVVPFARPAGNQQRRSSRIGTFPLGAAAAVIIVLAIGAVAIGIAKNGGEKKSSPVAAASSSAAATSGASTAVVASGTNYTAGDIRSQVVQVVNGAAPNAAKQFGALAAGTDNSSAAAAAAAPAPLAAAQPSAAASESASAAAPASAPAAATSSAPAAPPLSVRTAPSGPLADPAALARCIQTLVQKTEQPVLVDYASFNGVPSTIIVLPDPDVAGKLDIYVEADTADCASQVTFVTFLPAPASPTQ